jgi:hypothetical protein
MPTLYLNALAMTTGARGTDLEKKVEASGVDWKVVEHAFNTDDQRKNVIWLQTHSSTSRFNKTVGRLPCYRTTYYNNKMTLLPLQGPRGQNGEERCGEIEFLKTSHRLSPFPPVTRYR